MLERWTLQFTPRSQAAAGGGHGAAPRLDTPAVYKRMVILLRSLYSYVRILPAYRLCRACQVIDLWSKEGLVLPISENWLAGDPSKKAAKLVPAPLMNRTHRHSEISAALQWWLCTERWTRELWNSVPHRSSSVARHAQRCSRSSAELQLRSPGNARWHLCYGLGAPAGHGSENSREDHVATAAAADHSQLCGW